MEVPAIDLKTGKRRGTISVEGLEANVKATVGYVKPLTIAFIEVNGTPGVGVSRCMKTDKWSNDVGAGIAIGRALKHIAEQIESTWTERSVTKAEWEKKHGKK